MNYFVYIIECSDKSLYVGVTNDYEQRLFEHREGINIKAYTYSRRPLQLIYVERFSNINHAIEFEKQVKGWSRKKKLSYIENSFDGLVDYNKANSSLPRPSTGSV